MDNSPLGPTRVDNGPLQGPRSSQQLDKDAERTTAIEKCGPTQTDNLQESERYAGPVAGQVSAGRGPTGKQSLSFTRCLPCLPVHSWLQTHSLKSKFPGKAALLKHTGNLTTGPFSQEPAMLIANATELLDFA